MASPEYVDKGKLSKRTASLLRNHSELLNTAVPATLSHTASVPHKWPHKRRDIKNKLIFAKLEQLDANCRYVGTQSGVVDLATGALLSRAEGRKHLVTRSTDVVYEPNATHPALYGITSHLQPDVAAFLWQFLARAMGRAGAIPDCGGAVAIGQVNLFQHDEVRPRPAMCPILSRPGQTGEKRP